MPPLSVEERSLLLALARESIERRLHGQPEPAPSADSLTPRLTRHAGAFVTLYASGGPGASYAAIAPGASSPGATSPGATSPSASSSSPTSHTARGELRGCVGLPFPEQPLYRAVVEAAASAAVEDPRFAPVTLAEFPHLKIEISVLTPPVSIMPPGSRRGATPSAMPSAMPSAPGMIADAIIPGTHGLLISKGSRRGLLLPQVATEYGWSAARFLSETCRKAGLPPDAWQHGATVETFTAEIITEPLTDMRVTEPRA